MVRDSHFETPTVRKVLEAVVPTPSEPDMPSQVRNKVLEELFYEGKLIFPGISRRRIDRLEAPTKAGTGELIKRVNEELKPNIWQASADIQELPEGAIWVLTRYAYFQDGDERVVRALKKKRSRHFHHLHYKGNLKAVAQRARDEQWQNVNPDTLDRLVEKRNPFHRFVDEGKIWIYGLHKTSVMEKKPRGIAPIGYEWLMGKSPIRFTYDRIFKGAQLLTAHVRQDYPEFDIEVLTKEYADSIRGRVMSASGSESPHWPRIRGLVTTKYGGADPYSHALLVEVIDDCADNAFLEDLHRQYTYSLGFPCQHGIALFLKRLFYPEPGQPKVTQNVVALPTEEMAGEAYKFVERGFVLDKKAERHMISDFLFSKLFGMFLARNNDRYDDLMWHFRGEPMEQYMLQPKG